MLLEKETAYFHAHLQEWLTTSAGKIALIKEDRLVGMFDSYQAAVVEGVRRFGLTSFLVREVSREEPRATILSLSFASATCPSCT